MPGPTRPLAPRFLQRLQGQIAAGKLSEEQARAITRIVAGEEDALHATQAQVDRVSQALKLKPFERGAVVFALLLAKVGPELSVALKNEVTVATSMGDVLGRFIKHLRTRPEDTSSVALERFAGEFAGPKAAIAGTGVDLLASGWKGKLEAEEKDGAVTWWLAGSKAPAPARFVIEDGRTKIGFLFLRDGEWQYQGAKAGRPSGKVYGLGDLDREMLGELGKRGGMRGLAAAASRKLEEIPWGSPRGPNPFADHPEARIVAKAPPAPQPRAGAAGAIVPLPEEGGVRYVYRPAKGGVLDPTKDQHLSGLNLETLAQLRTALLAIERARDPLAAVEGSASPSVTGLLGVVTTLLDAKAEARRRSLLRAEKELSRVLAGVGRAQLDRATLNELVRAAGLAP